MFHGFFHKGRNQILGVFGGETQKEQGQFLKVWNQPKMNLCHFLFQIYFQKLLVPLFWNNVYILYTNIFWILYNVIQLKAGSNESIWPACYPLHITLVDNSGEAWGTSSDIDNSGVSDPTLCIAFWFILNLFVKFKLVKNP